MDRRDLPLYNYGHFETSQKNNYIKLFVQLVNEFWYWTGQLLVEFVDAHITLLSKDGHQALIKWRIMLLPVNIYVR